MTSLRIFIFALLGMFCSYQYCQADNSYSSIYASGVSYQLAQKRKAEISDLHYKLHFQIPAEKGLRILGEETISFSWKGRKSQVIIDFRAEKSQLKEVTVNGRKAVYIFRDEHILLDASLFNTGKNEINMSFIAGDKPLNRNIDYLYTLFVPDHARQAFPCFDQPDLKARFSLSLDVPDNWEAVSGGKVINESAAKGIKSISFKETEPIPTYLFSFVAGKFFKKSCTKDDMTVTAYYRETDSTKTAQLPTIFNQVFSSIKWMEQYTKVAYPFSKYDFIILPGFQFGGMEHIGAVLYNDKRMFLNSHPTPDEELNRVELIAHETAHSWFGDLVTMKWFNDVWTKEVFANFMASKIAKQQFPTINHDLNFLKSYQIYALAEDRTTGTHPIQQRLDNLKNAGLLYGNIIYEKAPVMMRKLEQQMGSNAFQKGLQVYLKKFSFDNADWDNLIDILDKENPKAHLKEFSDVWVKQKGMPDITATLSKGKITVTQKDPLGRNCLWQQQFKMAMVENGHISQVVNINMQNKSTNVSVNGTADTIIPNFDGIGYGRFIVDKNSTQNFLKSWSEVDDINREAMLMTIYENFLMHKLNADECAASIIKGLKSEKNALIASTCCNYLSTIVFYQKAEARSATEKELWQLSQSHEIEACRQKLTRTLFSLATDSTVIDQLYNFWNSHNDKLFNEDDYTNFSYQLAIRKPIIWESILNKERSRISGADKLREFDFISRACTPDKEEQCKLFNSLLQKENRQIEPWAQQLLALLNSPLREPFSNRFIKPGLDVLQEIQQTGDIFFPTNWANALLSGHKSEEAKEIVETFIKTHPSYPTALKNKLLQAAYFLLKY